MPFEITLEKPDQTSAPPRSDTSTAPATPTPETTDFQTLKHAAIQEEEQRISALKSVPVAEGFPTESIADIRALILSRAQDTSDATTPPTMTEINRIVSMTETWYQEWRESNHASDQLTEHAQNALRGIWHHTAAALVLGMCTEATQLDKYVTHYRNDLKTL